MKRIKASHAEGHFGFDEWSLDAEEELQEFLKKFVAKTVKEGLALATKEYRCELSLRRWDATYATLLIGLPIGESDTDDVYWTVELSSIVDDLIDWRLIYEPEDVAKFRDFLRHEADRIDQFLSREPDAEE